MGENMPFILKVHNARNELIMSTNATRDTTTGLIFEEKVSGLNKHGINVTKHNLYHYMKSQGLD